MPRHFFEAMLVALLAGLLTVPILGIQIQVAGIDVSLEGDPLPVLLAMAAVFFGSIAPGSSESSFWRDAHDAPSPPAYPFTDALPSDFNRPGDRGSGNLAVYSFPRRC